MKPSSYRWGKWSPNSEEPQDLREGGIESSHHKPGHNPWDIKSIKYIKFVRVNDEWIKWLLDLLVPTSNSRSRMRQCDTEWPLVLPTGVDPGVFQLFRQLHIVSVFLLSFAILNRINTFNFFQNGQKAFAVLIFLFSLLLWSNFLIFFGKRPFFCEFGMDSFIVFYLLKLLLRNIIHSDVWAVCEMFLSLSGNLYCLFFVPSILNFHFMMMYIGWALLWAIGLGHLIWKPVSFSGRNVFLNYLIVFPCLCSCLPLILELVYLDPLLDQSMDHLSPLFSPYFLVNFLNCIFNPSSSGSVSPVVVFLISKKSSLLSKCSFS